MKDKPLPPGDYECCESGCDRCVWDIYREDLQEWEQQQQQLQQQQQKALASEAQPATAKKAQSS